MDVETEKGGDRRGRWHFVLWWCLVWIFLSLFDLSKGSCVVLVDVGEAEYEADDVVGDAESDLGHSWL